MVQRGSEIRYEVVGVFDSYREAKQRILDSRGCSCRLVHRGMRHRRWMRDQALNTAQGFCEGETLKCVDEPLHAIDSTVYFEAHHCAEAGLLRSSNAVPRM
jgi:hypothetical protein